MNELRWCVLFILTLNCPAALSAERDEQSEQPRPKLQIINASQQTLDVFWLKSDAERVPNGSIEPAEDLIIDTTLGHKFAVVGREDHCESTVTSLVPFQGFRFDPAAKDGVPAFYTQRVDVEGFPIVASDRVSPFAMQEAAWIVRQMLTQRPDVRQAMIDSGARLCVMAHDEFTTDLPEFSHLGNTPVADFPELSGKDFWDARARGTGGSQTDPFCSCAEENLLGYSGDPYHQECILIHELAHCIHLRGMVNVDVTFDDRLRETYHESMQAGLWQGKYASVNHHEYFAEGVQSWFGNNRINDHDHNHVNTRALLIEYDPGLAELCREVFGETEIQYTKPATRLCDHLADYNPDTAPTFVWPPRLEHARTAISEHARSRSQVETKDQPEPQLTRQVSGWTVHISPQLLHQHPTATDQALELLQRMLAEMVSKVPEAAVVELQKVPLWFSPEYAGIGPRAEYHPGAGWLKDNGRDPAMVHAVEFTNVLIFEKELRRMPNFALHELAHAYHHRVLNEGFENEQIIRAYEHAKASGSYDSVERQDASGNKHMDRAYAMTNPQEYFAETTEAYFSRNDFYPYDNEQLEAHDPSMFELLAELWGML